MVQKWSKRIFIFLVYDLFVPIFRDILSELVGSSEFAFCGRIVYAGI